MQSNKVVWLLSTYLPSIVIHIASPGSSTTICSWVTRKTKGSCYSMRKFNPLPAMEIIYSERFSWIEEADHYNGYTIHPELVFWPIKMCSYHKRIYTLRATRVCSVHVWERLWKYNWLDVLFEIHISAGEPGIILARSYLKIEYYAWHSGNHLDFCEVVFERIIHLLSPGRVFAYFSIWIATVYCLSLVMDVYWNYVVRYGMYTWMGSE